MRLDAMKRQAGRPSQENGAPVVPNSLTGKSRDMVLCQDLVQIKMRNLMLTF
jgi:hypothetical protein